MKHLHSLRGGAHGVPSGAHSYQIFGIYHEKRLLYIIVMSLWTFTVIPLHYTQGAAFS